MKNFLIFIAALALAFSTSSRAADLDMSRLMGLLASGKHIRAEFVERKFLKILDAPVESSGELVFRAPSRLEKRTKLP
ncbi:MAG: hypothetical protein B7Y42_04070, partial [Polaromonas sp. 28-63-22]